MPLGTIIYFIIEGIFYVTLSILILVHFFDFKINWKTSISIFTFFSVLENVEASITAPYLFIETHFSHNFSYILMIYLTHLCFYLCFASIFLKGHPIRNYMIFMLLSYSHYPVLTLFSIIRKTLGYPSLINSSTLSDFPTIACIFASFCTTWFILNKISRKYKNSLQRVPISVCWLSFIIFLVLDFTPYLISILLEAHWQSLILSLFLYYLYCRYCYLLLLLLGFLNGMEQNKLPRYYRLRLSFSIHITKRLKRFNPCLDNCVMILLTI